MENNLENYDKKDIESGKVMAILSYIIPLIPYFAEKENKWVRFHAIQGMNLLIIAVAINVVLVILTSLIFAISWRLWGLAGLISTLTMLINIGIGVFCVLGIVNVCQEKAKELPLISKIKIIKK